MSAISDYLRAIRREFRGEPTEHSYRTALKELLEELRPGVVAQNEPKHRRDCGAPDMNVRDGTGAEALTIGYLECKDIGVSLDAVEESDQLTRYRDNLDNLVLTDYLQFRWYVEGDERARATLAHVSGDRIVADTAAQEQVRELLEAFLACTPEPITSPRELAQRMAKITRMIRDIIVSAFERDEISDTTQGLYEAFTETLLPDLDEGEFADMFAQTLAYGLFAARVNHRGPEPFQRIGAAREIPKTNPFLRQLFDAITGVALDEEPFVGFVDDLTRLLAHADIGAILEDFGASTRQEDPIVHFYETFLAAYDPRMREMRGVYYTPEPVVSYIVRSVDWILKEHFDLPGGLADQSTVTYEVTLPDGSTEERTSPKVLILDPACGTGTFLYHVIEHIRRQFVQSNNAGMWPGFVRKQLLPRLFGFELLMAPYAVAHLKLGMQLAAQDMTEAQRERWAYDFREDQRLGVYLTNTLEEAEQTAQRQFGIMQTITDEANAAAEIKRDMPIMVVLGNPPYSGHSANKGEWIDGLLKGELPDGTKVDSYYEVDGEPLRERNPKWLQDDYVKFIRFGQWRIEQSGAGVLAFITNHGYLDNPTFRGMRQSLKDAFSDIYILNLHGNSLKKETAPHGGTDENVFDIRPGVAIGLLVRNPRSAPPARVHYADLWGLRQDKYASLRATTAEDTNW
ncbi:MAG: N-6 DNA methylase, partial [Armatimonadota bacterium]